MFSKLEGVILDQCTLQFDILTQEKLSYLARNIWQDHSFEVRFMVGIYNDAGTMRKQGRIPKFLKVLFFLRLQNTVKWVILLV